MTTKLYTKARLDSVRLPDGPVKARANLNGKYLLQLETDRLLHNFRINAGIKSDATPLGGWESPTCGLRGHFVGHYLTACSQMFASSGDVRFKGKLEQILDDLQECQLSLGDGYLSAFASSEFDILEQKYGGVWAPYYTIHKILAGLIDAYRNTQSKQALAMATQLGLWIAKRILKLTEEILEPMLRTDQFNPSNEYGGIGESMYDLFEITGYNDFFQTAICFDREWFISPLIENKDILAGLHANTHIPQVLAITRRYELTGDEQYRNAAIFFWEQTALARSYVNGGSSGPRPDHNERSEGAEHWPIENNLHGTLTPKINESCVIHNMIRLSDRLFEWTGDHRYAEFREKIWMNSVLCMQHPNYPGGYIYGHPLSGGSRKVYGDPDQTFWCCYGTSIEAFSRLGDGIYFCSGNMITICQFISSVFQWNDSVKIIQNTFYPFQPATRITIQSASPVELEIKIRIPESCKNIQVRIGDTDYTAGNDSFVTIHRQWSNNDTIEINFTMALHIQPLLGDPRLMSFLYGPIVLAARTPHSPELDAAEPDALNLITANQSKNLSFKVRLVSGAIVDLVPLNQIVDEPFGVYFMTPQ